jgi:hypothetical protein
MLMLSMFSFESEDTSCTSRTSKEQPCYSESSSFSIRNDSK